MESHHHMVNGNSKDHTALGAIIDMIKGAVICKIIASISPVHSHHYTKHLWKLIVRIESPLEV